MRRAEWLQEVRKMRFKEVYTRRGKGRLTQEEAAEILGVCDRTFHRYIDRYERGGMDGLDDKRLSQASSRLAPVDEVMGLIDEYRSRYRGWNVQHYFKYYREGGGKRGYTWVKNRLQSNGLVSRKAKRGVHRKRRDRKPMPGMMLHQDGSRHEWVPGKKWDLIVTMDDATNEHYSMFFVDERTSAAQLLSLRWSSLMNRKADNSCAKKAGNSICS